MSRMRDATINPGCARYERREAQEEVRAVQLLNRSMAFKGEELKCPNATVGLDAIRHGTGR